MHSALVAALPDADAVEGGEEFVAGHGWVLWAGLGWRGWVLVEALLVRIFRHCSLVSLPPSWPPPASQGDENGGDSPLGRGKEAGSNVRHQLPGVGRFFEMPPTRHLCKIIDRKQVPAAK